MPDARTVWPLTVREFIRGYCERSGVTWTQLHKRRHVVPCWCEEPGCQGWAMVPKYARSHNGLPPYVRKARSGA